VSWSVETDEEGGYQRWIDKVYTPLTVTTTYPDHKPSLVAGVRITDQVTTPHNVSLRWRQPCVNVVPSSISATLDMGISTTLPLSISNTGAGNLVYEFQEQDKGFQIASLSPGTAPETKPRERYENYKPDATTTAGIMAPEGSEPLNILVAGDVLAEWASGLATNWGTVYIGENDTVWLGSDDDLDHEFQADGTVTGRTIDTTPWIGAWAGDMAYNPKTGMIWQVNVGGDNCIYELNPTTGTATGNTICDSAWTGTSQRGLAYDPTHDIFFIGGWNDSDIYQIQGLSGASPGAVIQQWTLNLGVSGLAYHHDAGQLFIIENSSTDAISQFDVASGTIVNVFIVSSFGSHSGAGLGIDCDGNLWAANQKDNHAYLIDSGVPGSLCSTSAPWLFETPITGTVLADGGLTPITVTLDAAQVAQPGEYYAILNINSDDPLSSHLKIPVTMTVPPPAMWSKLKGTVTTLGYCDATPTPLEGAEVLIQSWMTETITVTYPITLTVQDFEADDGDFIPDLSSEWAWGIPTFPTDISAHSGLKVWGTNLDAEADDTIGSHHLTKRMTFPANVTRLEWWDWYGDEASDERQLYIDGQLVWNDNGGTDQMYWAKQAVNVSAWANQTVDVVFALDVCCNDPGPEGWYIDDVAVIGSEESQVDAPVSWSVETDEEGGYQRWIDKVYTPLTVTTTYPDHKPSLVAGVRITDQVTTPHNVSLRWRQPCVNVVPSSISATLDMGISTTLPLSISNSGALATAFQLIEAYEDKATLGIGTPRESSDPFGYTYRDSDEVNGPTYNFVDISATGMSVPLSDDDYAGPFDLEFTLDFYGTDWSQYYISSNGFLSFGSGSTGYGNTCPLPNTNSPNNLVAVHWDDLNPSAGGTIYRQSFSECPYGPGACEIVMFDNVPHYDGNSAGVFEVILFENNSLLMQYQDPGTEAGSGATSGIENHNGTAGLTYATCNATYLSANLAVCFTYPGNPSNCVPADVPWLFEDPITGTIAKDGGLALIDITLDAAYATHPREYYATLKVANDDPFNSRVEVPVTMTVRIPETYGRLEGTVASTGYCDANPTLLKRAKVQIEGMAIMPTTDNSGTYAAWLDQGTYTITYSAAEHLSNTAVVNIIAGATTTHDASLRWLQPCVSVTPPSISATLDMGISTTLPLSISNSGAAGLQFALQELEHGSDLLEESLIINVPASKPTAVDEADPAPYLLLEDILWLSEDPTTGTVPVDGGLASINVTLDGAKVAQPGEHTATLSINSDDPINSRVEVPVAMTVRAPATWGKLKGFISSNGYCDANPAPLKGARLHIEGVPITPTTDVNGTYTVWLDEGTYTVSVSANKHVSDTAVVVISAQTTTIQDFVVRSIQPCISVAPTSMEIVLSPGETKTQILTLLNAGAAPSTFKCEENIYATSMTEIGVVGADSNWASTLNVDPNLNTDFTFVDLGDDWTYSTIQDYTSVLVNERDHALTIGETDALRRYYNAGGAILLGMDDVDAEEMPEQADIYATFGVTNAMDGDFYAGTLNNAHPIAEGVTLVDMGNDNDHFDEDGATWVVRGNDGNDYVLAQDNKARTVIFGEQLERWWLNGNQPLVRNAIKWSLQHNVPWVSEDPIAGTVRTDSTYDVAVTFRAMTYSVGTYTTMLSVNTDDLVSPTIEIPIAMHITVCTPVSSAQIDFTPEAPLVGKPVTFTCNVAAGTRPITYNWDFDNDGVPEQIGVGLDTINHTFDTAGTYTVEVALWNCDMIQADAVTDRISLNVQEQGACQALDDVTIQGATSGTPGEHTFTAECTPDDASLPITYTWTPTPTIGQATDMVTYTWPISSTQTISVAATNRCSPSAVIDTHTITIRAGLHYVYLPLVLRD
jgi:hypothetical protein